MIAVSEKAELKSPGYPYVLSEYLSCRWLLEAPVDQVIFCNFLETISPFCGVKVRSYGVATVAATARKCCRNNWIPF